MGSAAAWCSAASPGVTRHSAIREANMADANSISLAVWDVPMPVVADEPFSIKVGATGASGHVEVIDSAGAVVASGKLGDAPWRGTEALRWTALDLPAPKADVARYTVRCGTSETWFSIAATAKPEHMLTVQVTEQDTAEPLADVEIRIGAFHARTDKSGRTEIPICAGEYLLHLWRTAHIAAPQPITIDRDVALELTMRHVPEEHPDARWVR
jgi:hypothetical protein